MHRMPFRDGEFRSIVCGWTISYSFDPNLAAHEMSRVLMPGGVIVFGVEVTHVNNASGLNIPMGDDRLQTRSQFERLLPAFECVAFFEPEGDGNLIIALKKPLTSPATNPE
jgi:ubiquinone/menaquinone biosynthesis C-methylase UbiE